MGYSCVCIGRCGSSDADLARRGAAASSVWGPPNLQWQTPLRAKWTHRDGVTYGPMTPTIDLTFIVTPCWGRRV